MMFSPFNTTTYAKWILSGEHAVLRGHPAIVFPLPLFYLSLSYAPSLQALTLQTEGKHDTLLSELVYLILEEGHRLLSMTFQLLRGQFKIENQIPLGQGLGGSAALCVALSRWFEAQYGLKDQTLFEFSKKLEHLFHGQSSGLDIAGVSSTKDPVYFQQNNFYVFESQAKPYWYLSSTGSIGQTSACVQQVNDFRERYPIEAQAVDEQMKESVLIAKKALLNNTLADLKRSIDMGYDCFKRWGLISEVLEQHIYFLKEQGALAVKPTGSGQGGYLISLWDSPPPDHRNDSWVQI